jgi:hypothetical protein
LIDGDDMTARLFLIVAPLAGALFTTACAFGTQPPAGVKAGEFARLACDGGRTFAVRMAEDGKSARVRALHGAAELSLQPDAAYIGDDYKLAMPASAAATLWHKGKVEAEQCKVQAS